MGQSIENIFISPVSDQKLVNKIKGIMSNLPEHTFSSLNKIVVTYTKFIISDQEAKIEIYSLNSEKEISNIMVPDEAEGVLVTRNLAIFNYKENHYIVNLSMKY